MMYRVGQPVWWLQAGGGGGGSGHRPSPRHPRPAVITDVGERVQINVLDHERGSTWVSARLLIERGEGEPVPRICNYCVHRLTECVCN